MNEFCSIYDGFCSRNDGFCIINDGFCRGEPSPRDCSQPPAVRVGSQGGSRIRSSFNFYFDSIVGFAWNTATPLPVGSTSGAGLTDPSGRKREKCLQPGVQIVSNSYLQSERGPSSAGMYIQIRQHHTYAVDCACSKRSGGMPCMASSVGATPHSAATCSQTVPIRSMVLIVLK